MVPRPAAIDKVALAAAAPPPFLEQLGQAVRAWGARLDQPLLVIAERADKRPQLVQPFDVAWRVMTRGSTRVACNLAGQAQAVPVDDCPGSVLLASADGVRLSEGAIYLPAQSVAIIELSPLNPAHQTL